MSKIDMPRDLLKVGAKVVCWRNWDGSEKFEDEITSLSDKRMVCAYTAFRGDRWALYIEFYGTDEPFGGWIFKNDPRFVDGKYIGEEHVDEPTWDYNNQGEVIRALARYERIVNDKGTIFYIDGIDHLSITTECGTFAYDGATPSRANRYVPDPVFKYNTVDECFAAMRNGPIVDENGCRRKADITLTGILFISVWKPDSSEWIGSQIIPQRANDYVEVSDD
jgi:hypothetical protein